MPPQRKRLLFVCIENANRSQMAEAWARILGGDRVDAWSAGSQPSGRVHPRAVASMKRVGYDLAAHTSKLLTDLPSGTYDVAVSMGCGDACPLVPARRREAWQIPDPRDFGPERFDAVRDQIRDRVRALLRDVLGAKDPARGR